MGSILGFKLTIDPVVAATFRGRASGDLRGLGVPGGAGFRPELPRRGVERVLLALEVAHEDLVEDVAHGQALSRRSVIARRGALTMTSGRAATCGSTSTGVRGPTSIEALGNAPAWPLSRARPLVPTMAAAKTAERAAWKLKPLLLLFMALSSLRVPCFTIDFRWVHFGEAGAPEQTGFLNPA